MAKRKKYQILGGVKVNSEQLSEWGSCGGRPRKWENEAQRKRWEREQKKGSPLRPYKSYGEEKIKKFITCPNCGKVNENLKQYFNQRGEYISETYWFDTVKMEKTRRRENKYYCDNCFHSFSFLDKEIEAEKIRTKISRAGTTTERSQRKREKKLYKINN